MKIIIVGGHHNSALVVAKMLIKRSHKIFWFGHKHTMVEDKSLSAEYLEVKKNNIDFTAIYSSKFYNTGNPFKYLKLIFGIIQSLTLLLKIKPDLILSFGGYLSFPVVFAGWILKIPSFIHEQTTQAGSANKILARFAKKIFLTWPSSLPYFPNKKTHLIGLPVKNYPVKTLNVFKNKLPVILITGGKQGSHLINRLIEERLSELLRQYNIVHQTGRVLKTGDLQRLIKIRNLLPENLKLRYLLKPYFFEEEMLNFINQADLIVSRAGAHICYELLIFKKPCLLIPIHWAHSNEQYKNALILQSVGLAKILSEKNLTSRSLYENIEQMTGNNLRIDLNKNKINNLIKMDAAEKMVDFIEKESQKNTYSYT